ncbi:hypothetical protein L227DRAFT_652628 [Lentinus tigrinus ALCF2SS1-6]|uniref:F-box domain-containing protein n=1 Tax=Lentinus tigrinus ALCF2SS1-6 TaxID=1328759 RepID=A0A5C2SDX8_9APHY|nr:hypothetical protein L227DRAFT_652628 [Lentinus tigrinus ALCF2SS1-6]
MPAYIPPEIIDDIISAVSVDRDRYPGYYTLAKMCAHTLAMCALVCRAWLPRSRARLFEVICIRNQHSYDMLVERVVWSETMSKYLPSVNSLYLEDDSEHSLSSAARLFLIEFTGKLPGLRELYVNHLDWTHQQPCVKWPLLLSQFRTITYLRLDDCRFSSFNDVRRLLTALPLLSTLQISLLRWPMVSQELHLHTTPRSCTCWPELRTLDIYYPEAVMPRRGLETLLKWITAALGASGPTVKKLSCGFYGLPPTGLLRATAVDFVRRVGQSVTDLHVRLVDNLPLSEFLALKYLSCDLYRYQGNWGRVASVLQDVSSKMIQSITFYTYTLSRSQRVIPVLSEGNNDGNSLHFDHDSLEELDRVLSHDPFRNLQEVIFEVDAHEKDQEELLRAHARRYLPNLCERRKILRVKIYRGLEGLEVDREL